MAKIFRALKSPSLAIDGTADHVHILFSLGRVISVADLLEEVKTESSNVTFAIDSHCAPSALALRDGVLPGPLAQAIAFRAFGA